MNPIPSYVTDMLQIFGYEKYVDITSEFLCVAHIVICPTKLAGHVQWPY